MTLGLTSVIDCLASLLSFELKVNSIEGTFWT